MGKKLIGLIVCGGLFLLIWKGTSYQSTIEVENPVRSGNEQTAILANGCFWCVEHDLEEVPGVIEVISGYSGGTSENPSYQNYAEGGHREVVEVTYDPALVSYASLVEHIIKHGDPTDASGSFGDRGFQYAPVIYHENELEKAEAKRVIAAIDALHIFEAPLALAIEPRQEFWPAEEYHQDYSKKNPLKYGYYRNASGRDDFIQKYWGDDANTFTVSEKSEHPWESFVKISEEEIQARLTPLQFEVTQNEGTEPPFENEYDKHFEEGIYVDILSGEPLYSSQDKYDSGTGWPSFTKPISETAVVLKEDHTLFGRRTEVRSRFADSHLGHVFEDGPAEKGGKRYCMNSAALRFIAKNDMQKEGYGYLLAILSF